MWPCTHSRYVPGDSLILSSVADSDVIAIKITDNNYVCHSRRTWHSHNSIKVYLIKQWFIMYNIGLRTITILLIYILFSSYHFNHDLVSTTYAELQSKKNIPDLMEKISWLSISEILHKAPPRLITKATETSLTGPKKPNNKIREQQPSWYVAIRQIMKYGWYRNRWLIIFPDNNVT